MYMILELLGIVYKNSTGKKAFLKMKEIAHYCYGTLNMIKLQLKSKLSLDDQAKKKVNSKDRVLVERC